MASEVTDWISAGANVAAAIGTVGALWVGAVTLRRQVNDKRREQASAVTVGYREDKQLGRNGEQRRHFFIRNASSLPIYDVTLYGAIPWPIPRKPRPPVHREVLAPGEEESVYSNNKDAQPHAMFKDSAGVTWERYVDGRLRELKIIDSSRGAVERKGRLHPNEESKGG